MEAEFDWYEELYAAILKEPTKAEWKVMEAIASSWVTCACGQLCKDLPCHHNGSPLDDEAHNLGMKFYDYICYKRWKDAIGTLDKIEERTAYLLRN